MEQFELIQEFIERTERATTLDELGTGFHRVIATLGFRYFACCSHADPLRLPRGAFVIHSYPAAWARTFCQRRFHRIDPVFQQAERARLPFYWDTALRVGLTSDQREILVQASEFGIAHGYTVPLRLPEAQFAYPASCSLVPDAPSLATPVHYCVQLLAYRLYQAASRIVGERQAVPCATPLSKRERQCLELVAQGKSDWVAGKLLGISERTVHNHIERAKRRFKVATRVQAIVLALASRQISFGDVIRAEIDASRSTVTNADRKPKP